MAAAEILRKASASTSRPEPAALVRLAMASARLTRGQPTLDEVTALAVLLAEQLHGAAADEPVPLESARPAPLENAKPAPPESAKPVPQENAKPVPLENAAPVLPAQSALSS